MLQLPGDLGLGDEAVAIIGVVYVFPIEPLERYVAQQVAVDRGMDVTHGPAAQLVLDPQVRLDYGWEAAALKHMNARRDAAGFRLQSGEGGWLSSLRPPKARALLAMKQERLILSPSRKLDARGWV